MNEPLHTASVAHRSDPFGEHQEKRKKRLTALLGKGLPTLPAYLLDLAALLGSPAVDLKKVANVIRTDPSLAAQVLRLCNSALFGLRRHVLSIEQAAVLLGTERLRSLVLTCGVMQLSGKNIPVKHLMGLWHHSFLAALLSERIAKLVEYPEKEQAYLGGLLHDIGQLPLWMLVIEEEKAHRPPPPEGWADNLAIERDYFGMDHGKVGRWMAVSWNFMPSFLDVFEHHHDPENAQHDPYLVGIVAAADQFLQGTSHVERAPAALTAEQPPASPVASSVPEYLIQCLPRLADEEREKVLQMLTTEYAHVLPLVELSISAIAPDSAASAPLGQEQKREQATSTNRG